jgi:flavin-dependent dehydrogenase
MKPIEIVGGGLAGLSLGIALRRHQIPVTLHEAGHYPRHRVCGEFIAGLSQATIARLQLDAALTGALVHRDVAWHLPGESPFIQRLPAPALGLSRHLLDSRLADQFVALGGELHTRARISDDAASSTPASTPGRVHAYGRRRASSSRWLGLKIHVRDLTLVRELELHLGDGCYVGLSRIENNEVNVCGLFQRREISERGANVLLAYLRAADLTDLATRIEGATIDEGSFCAVAAVEFDRRVPISSSPGVRLGDAAAMIPPFTGNGMAMAFQSAESALDPLLDFARGKTDWVSTCAASQAALQARFRVRLASSRALHPFLLQGRWQRWLARLARARLLPFRALYAALH